MSSQGSKTRVDPDSEDHMELMRQGLKNAFKVEYDPTGIFEKSLTSLIFQVEIRLNTKEEEWVPIRALNSVVSKGSVLLDFIGPQNLESTTCLQYLGGPNNKSTEGVSQFGYQNGNVTAGFCELIPEDVMSRGTVTIRRYIPNRRPHDQFRDPTSRDVKVSIVNRAGILKSNYFRSVRPTPASDLRYASHMGWDIVLHPEVFTEFRLSPDYTISRTVQVRSWPGEFALRDGAQSRSRVDWEYVPSDWRQFWPGARDQRFTPNLLDVVHGATPEHFNYQRRIIPVTLSQGETSLRIDALIAPESSVNIISERLMRLLKKDRTTVNDTYPEFFDGFTLNSHPNTSLQLGRSWFGDPCMVHLSGIERSDNLGQTSPKNMWSGDIRVYPMQWKLLKHIVWSRNASYVDLSRQESALGWDIVIGGTASSKISPWLFCRGSQTVSMSPNATRLSVSYWGEDKRMFSDRC